MRFLLPIITFSFLCCLPYASAMAQTAQSKDMEGDENMHKQKTAFRPKALLVQLHTETNRMNYFREKGNNAMADRVADEAQHIATVTVNDFNDHFDFCRVYFFFDTALEAIKNQNFSGHLVNADASPVTNCILQVGDTDYFIVYYGTPENPKTSLWAGNDVEYRYGAGNVIGHGLIFMNHHYQQKDYYYIINNFRNYFAWIIDPRYEFYSRKFDMEYRPLAARYNKDLKQAFSH